MPRARDVYAALERDGWIQVHRSGSHIKMRKGHRQMEWAFHEAADLGTVQMKQVAKKFGYTLEELRKLL